MKDLDSIINTNDLIMKEDKNDDYLKLKEEEILRKNLKRFISTERALNDKLR